MKLVFNESKEAKRIASKAAALVPDGIKQSMHGIQMYLCGGVFVSLISGEPVNDLDFFFASQDDLTRFWERIKHHKDISKVYETDNAISFSYDGMKIQLVRKMFFINIHSCLEVFDFRAVQCGMTADNLLNKDGFMSEENSLYDIASKTLVVMPNHRNPHNVTYRIAKYVKRGWSIKGQSFIRLVLQMLIRGRDIRTIADVKDEIMGMDTVILADFFKNSDKYKHAGSIQLDGLVLKDFMDDVDTYFEEFFKKTGGNV